MCWFYGHEACGILATPPGIEPTPPALEVKVLTTELSGKIPHAPWPNKSKYETEAILSQIQ